MNQSISDMLHTLHSEFEHSRPNVLLVVGSGVSFGATGEERAKWDGLLENGVKRLLHTNTWNKQEAECTKQQIRKTFTQHSCLDTVIELAQQITTALRNNEDEYSLWLKESIGTLQVKPEKKDTLNEIANLYEAGALVLTTNYDDLLSNACNTNPVIWLNPGEFLNVINRKKPGILHMHGHWETPDSIVFGQVSYDDILGHDVQELFRSLWLHWHWVYIGCGAGLRDPNIGKLLSWGREKYGSDGLSHYLLARKREVTTNTSPVSSNLKFVYYEDHRQIPDLLKSIEPPIRPFEIIDSESTVVRKPNTSFRHVLAPSWEELCNGIVPSTTADSKAQNALESYGYAFIRDVASVGKTTLALRLAARCHKGRDIFYLDLSNIANFHGDDDKAAERSLRQLSRRKTLIIVDNAHLQPTLALKLWESWNWSKRAAQSRCSQLLLISTIVQETVGVRGADDLSVVQKSNQCAVIMVRPNVQDMASILRYVVHCIGNRDHCPCPPTDVLRTWHETFSYELGAFCAAIVQQYEELRKEAWELAPEHATEWMQNRHIRHLANKEKENLTCISAFAQRFDMYVTATALPNRNCTGELLRGGLVQMREVGRRGHVIYSVHNRSLGALAISALQDNDGGLSTEDQLLKAAKRDVSLALYLSYECRASDGCEFRDALWRCLEKDANRTISQLAAVPLKYTVIFYEDAIKNGKATLGRNALVPLLSGSRKIAQRDFGSELYDLCYFVRKMTYHGQQSLLQKLWKELIEDVETLTSYGRTSSLSVIAVFIGHLSSQGQDDIAGRVWKSFKQNKARHINGVSQTSIADICLFLRTTHKHGKTRLTEEFWTTIIRCVDQLLDRAFGKSAVFSQISLLVDAASDQKQDLLLNKLWSWLIDNRERVKDSASFAPLNDVRRFISKASGYRIELSKFLWIEIGRDFEGLTERLSRIPLGLQRLFIDTLNEQGQGDLAKRLIAKIDVSDERVLQSALTTSLEEVRIFIRQAIKQGDLNSAKRAWEELAKDKDRFVRLVLASALEDLCSFVQLYQREKQGKNALSARLYNALESERQRLTVKVAETPIKAVRQFIEFSAKAGRGVIQEIVWSAVQEDVERLKLMAVDAGWVELVRMRNGLRREGFVEVIQDIPIEKLKIFGNTRAQFGAAVYLITEFDKMGCAELARRCREIVVRQTNLLRYRKIGAIHVLAIFVSTFSRDEEGQMNEIFSKISKKAWRKWLREQYSKTPLDRLAKALTRLRWSEFPNIADQFSVSSLDSRVTQALGEVKTADCMHLSEIVQFLGAVKLIGRQIPHDEFSVCVSKRIERLPKLVCSGDNRIGYTERRLWVGLHAVTFLMPARTMCLDPDLVRSTLGRWKIAMRQADQEHDELKRLDEVLVAWLEAGWSARGCLQS